MSSTGHLSELDLLRAQVADLSRELAERDRSAQDLSEQSDLLRAIVEGTAAETGEEFFATLVTHLTSALHIKYAIIGEVQEDRIEKVRTLAVSAGGTLVDNFEYELAHTPCATALAQTFTCFDRDVQATFPQFQRLADLGAESYCGVPLRTKGGAVIGLLVVMDTKPLPHGNYLQSLLGVFAPRVAVEIERRRTEQKRDEALADLHNVVETAPDIMFTLDTQGNMVKWNRRVRDVTGYSPEELLGMPALAFVPPEEQTRTAAAIQRAFTEGYAELEGHLLTKEHRLIPYHWTGALFKNPHGEPIGITGIGRDVSDKKRAEEELKQQRRRLVDAQAIAHLGSWEWDVDSGEVQWSDELYRIFGHEPGSIRVTYDTFLAALLPDDHDLVLAAINNALIGKMPYDIEYRIVRPNGDVRVVHARGEVHRDATGHPLSMAGTVLDITERNQVEEALLASEERWQLAVRGSNDGIWDWNIQTGEVYFSARWKAMRGYEESELANSISEWQSRIHPDDLERVLQRIDQYLAKQRPEYCEEYRVEQKDGSYKWVLDRGMALWADDGTPLRMAGSESDITGHRQAILRLAEQGSLLRSILDAEPECVKRVAADGTLLQMNNAGLCFIETDSFQQVAGRSVYDLVAPEFLELYRSMHKAVIQGASQQFEFQIVGLKGTRRWMETHAVPLQNPIDRTVEQLAITRDITERKQTETALRASEERFRALVEETTDWMWEINEQGRYTYCSPKIRDLLGYEPDEAIEKTPFDFMPEGEASRVANLLGPIVAARKPFAGIENTNRHKDGRLVVLECRGVPIIDANGVFRGYRGFDQDITERKRAEEALRHSERQLRTVLDALPMGVWFTDRSGKPTLANPAAKQIWSNIKQIGLQTTNNQSGWWETIGPANEPHRWALSEALTAGVPSLNETFDLECLDGTKKVIRNSTVPVQDEAGVILGAIVLNEDITMLRKAQAALQLTQFSVDHVVEGFFWIGPDARIFHVNDAACRMLEYTREELMTMTMYDIDPNLLPEVWPAHWEELKQKGSSTFESKQWSRTGRVMDTEINVKYLQYEGKEYNCAIMRDIGERKRAEAALRTSEEQFRTMFTQAPIGMALIDSLTGKIHEVNTEYAQIVGRTTEEMRSLDWISITHPDDVQADLDNMARLNAGEIAGFKMEKRYVRPDGTVAWINLTVAPIQIEQHAGTCHLAMIEDITERKVNEQFLAGEKRILEMIATDVPLQEVLTLVCQVVEAHSHRAHCSILLLDPDGLHLRHGAAPSLPEAYVHAVDGLAIGPTVGSCGTAVFTRCQVIVSDIARDPLWADFRDLALRHGLLACWSTPVIASDGTVLGAFAVYYGKPQLPTDADLRLIERAVYIACIAIERRQAAQEQYRLIENLTRSQQHFQALFNWTPSAVGISTVAEGRFCDVNEGFSRLTGYAREEVIGRKTLDLGLWADPSDRAIVLREIREQGYLHNREGLLRTKSGEIRSLMVSVDSIQLGSTPCLIYLAHDITERKQVEAALRQSEERFRTMFAQAPIGIAFIDSLTGQIHEVNARYAQIAGRTMKELLGLDWMSISHPDDVQADSDNMAKLVTGDIAGYQMEKRLVRSDGTVAWIHLTVAPIQIEAHAGPHHLAMMQDITARKQAEESLRQSEGRLRSFMMNSPSVVFFKALDGRYLYVNRKFERLFQLSAEHIIGKTDYEVFSREQADQFTVNDRRVLQEGHAIETEETASYEDGTHTSLVMKFPVCGADGSDDSVWGIGGIVTDITLRKRAEGALRLTQWAVDRGADMAFWITRNAGILYVNDATCQRLGYSRDELLAMTFTDLDPDYQLSRWTQHWDDLRKQKRMRFETSHRTKSGEIFPVEIVANHVAFEGQEYNFAFSRDITDRKRAEEDLRQGERDLRAAIEERERISQDLHDGILQSLFAVGLTLEVSKSMLSPKTRKTAGVSLDQAIDRLNLVMREVRNFIAGLGSDPLQGKDLPRALQQMLASLTENQATRVRLAVEDRAAQAVSAKQALHLFLVIQEAVSNCIQHGRAQEARVSLKMLKQGVRLSIRDNGRGFNLGAAKGTGHGLGNMAARAKKIGGRFTILSKVNEGTSIVLDLPKEAADVRS